MRIQVDLFEVGLGAAMLLQFDDGKDVVRVLADGGVHDNPPEHVRDKLPAALSDFHDGSFHIDLMIGTHYDADHLVGLVPVVEQPGFTIGEAWLPPVANDTQRHALNDNVPDEALLALQFAGPSGTEILRNYLEEKARLCDELAEAELIAAGEDYVEHAALPEPDRHLFSGTHAEGERTEGALLSYFEAHIKSAEAIIGEGQRGHADDAVEDIVEDLTDFRTWDRFHYWDAATLSEIAKSLGFRQHGRNFASSLALIRKSTARQAITAASLAKLVTAFKAKQVPIRCSTIAAFTPRRFVWNRSQRRFIPAGQAPSAGPELLLMGPSEELVKKHWDRLPIGSYAQFLTKLALPIKHITPSNQLSYVIRFSFAEQNILVTGDSGFVDFRPERTRDYYKPLLDCLAPLHVVQVAHHAGSNAYFYGALLASPFPSQDFASFLLLSHGVDDPLRPSKEFGGFIETVRRDTNNVRLLFASQPLDKHVRDFKDLFVPATAAPKDRGDVRLIFDNGHWTVAQHLVQP